MSTTYRRYDPEWQLAKALAAYLTANLADEISAGAFVGTVYAAMSQEHKGQSVLAHCHKADTDKADAGYMLCECSVVVKSDIARGSIEDQLDQHFDLVNTVRDRLMSEDMNDDLIVNGFVANGVHNQKEFTSDGNAGERQYVVSGTNFTVRLVAKDQTA